MEEMTIPESRKGRKCLLFCQKELWLRNFWKQLLQPLQRMHEIVKSQGLVWATSMGVPKRETEIGRWRKWRSTSVFSPGWCYRRRNWGCKGKNQCLRGRKLNKSHWDKEKLLEQMGFLLTFMKNSLTIKYPKLGGRFQNNFGKTEEGKVNDTKAIDYFV